MRIFASADDLNSDERLYALSNESLHNLIALARHDETYPANSLVEDVHQDCDTEVNP